MNHLDGVHEGIQVVNDRRGSARVERFDELLQRRQVLDVVLALVEGLCDGDVDLLPSSQRVEDCLPRFRSDFVVDLPEEGEEEGEGRSVKSKTTGEKRFDIW